ncbi:glyoxylate/hydroxypyruvate reductase A-like isoform X2 [Argiope bruennichi]|uniref:glyoxylate/hydroxypyruvate reductase A-like isoform X2 n=1 Tax=Argiope bruennichi TaxID=94029 RepID=UPI002494DB34|nr:glyoxylate/hydroxypyruvate reductase A-like isoform X2 [Argiope bruennichi]
MTKEQNLFRTSPEILRNQVKRWDKSIKLSDEGKVLIKDAEVLIMDCTYLSEMLYSLPNAKWIQTTWAGLELLMGSVDRTKPPPNFTLTRYVDPYFGELMSNYVIAQIINIERGFYVYHDAQKTATWSRPFFPDFRVLSDLTIGVLGAGKLGASVSSLLKKAGCSVLVFVRSSRSDGPTNNYDEVTTELNDVLEKCDYLVNVLPSTPETEGLLDGDVLKNCQKKPIFMNIGRGDIIKDSSIIKALKAGWISKAILDVFEVEPLPPDNPLWNTPEVYITPHIGAIPRIEGIAKFIAQNYMRYVKKEPLLNEVDWKKGY